MNMKLVATQLGVGMVRFRMKIEPNRTELFVKFKITELNQTVNIDTIKKI